MAELATIARPYADALFKASASDHAHTSQWLDRMADIAADPDLLRFASNPKSTVEQIVGLVAGVMKEPLSPVAQQFLHMVLENGRLSALPEMAAQFRAHMNVQGGACRRSPASQVPRYQCPAQDRRQQGAAEEAGAEQPDTALRPPGQRRLLHQVLVIFSRIIL